jgi:hypothetical protein
MPSVYTTITIPSTPPSRVREIFLDLPSIPKWSTALTSVSHKTNPSTPGADLKPNDIVAVSFSGMNFDATILENTAQQLKWQGSIPYIFTGEHYFRFEESEESPGGTKFVQGEDL